MVSLHVKGHHTVWVKKREWRRAVPVRYAVSGNVLVTFGDGSLRSLVAGDSTTIAVHEIAGGPLIASFGVSVVDVPPDEIDREAVLELLEHVPMGATLTEVNNRAGMYCAELAGSSHWSPERAGSRSGIPLAPTTWSPGISRLQ